MNIEDNYHTIALTTASWGNECIQRGSREEEEKEGESGEGLISEVTVIGIVNVAVARG